jgi:dihydrofolate reductase
MRARGEDMAGEILWHVTMSLDGFIAGPGDAMEWAFRHGKPGPVAEEVIASTGAILAGRRGYDLGAKPGTEAGGIYGGAWHGPMFVLTHHPDDAPDVPGITYLSDGIEDAVETARSAAGGKSLGIFGASIARQCLEHGLLEQIIVHLVPVLLGEGVRFYDAPGVGQIDMERTDLWEPGQITDLRFRITAQRTTEREQRI